ncbi:hypothetical protein ANOM_009596 [Aspergillus nomiae NRRL 13137]|uniref:Uncharacterized protein n=1 Tax=Aspergillus nomiae NRRL (strain ATCC 15546 / NRRL 13137 / CBS 260.88 / M93) TaxID=1509407 RepID=A0A0L1IU42_ASPN3|nr:uncharacterized protein ANOM_009596 [Aspergillus nomiae NRRL 13137]KNG83012.1 hypothetical protein ANOM_009596 [Aspergillus nomiae NRRL 13137]
MASDPATSTKTDDVSHTITTLAMTTAFTPPASCSSSWTYEPSVANNVLNGLLLQNAAASDNADPACFPSGFSQYGRKTADRVYSPGYCPIGYTSADVAIEQPTTTVVCCLSKYSYMTKIMENNGAIYAGCISTFPSTTSTIVTVRQDPKKSTQVQGPITMWAQPITIQLQSSDLSLFVSATPTTAASSTSDAPSTQPTTAHHTTAPPTATASGETTSSGSSGISTGAGIGIGVGAGVGGLIVLTAIGLWFFRRRRRANKNLTSMTDPFGSQGMPGYHRARKINADPAELDTSARQSQNIHELG